MSVLPRLHFFHPNVHITYSFSKLQQIIFSPMQTDWRQEKKGTTEDEMVGWHHQLDGHEFQQALGVGKGQARLPWCSPWGRKESDMTERLYWAEMVWYPPSALVSTFLIPISQCAFKFYFCLYYSTSQSVYMVAYLPGLPTITHPSLG